jgi:hypothetical protein
LLSFDHSHNFGFVESEGVFGDALMTVEHVFIGFGHSLVDLILPFITMQEVAVRSVRTLLLLEEVSAILSGSVGCSNESLVVDEIV